ncbi:10 TM acyl transferase domain found in Cas1p-domain-containing protein [Zychaea mexicana]|uniref:10 TM acyl transferase domain found in Cas1p-domain-containing protein n=1 Tax=Zychaea mexicana TaxID=64656 RepID=UPI0022FDC2E7|nr:10 TM acyl transferase domain found in Cas1p-domain-containing protein [Zychaea mexicana]KAI9498960.1 10 TM acyl transferase domain found in Cas1p-domain-containing protein [Zychaea mexicana]
MLNDGWWLEENYTKWQPSGCMPHTYAPQEISNCLNHSRVLYIGDSIMREQFYSMTKFVQGIETKGPLHIDRKYHSKELDMSYEFWWDPYINSTRTWEMLNATDPINRPSLLVIGSGVWYMRHLKEHYFDEWRVVVDRVMTAVQASNQVADAVMLSPVEIPQFDLLNDVRRETMTMDKITKMNNYLKAKEPTLSPQTPFVIPFAWNEICSSTVNITDDGLHYKPGVTAVQASLALNYRCNDLLPKHFPMENTCCTHYPVPAWYQNTILLFFLLWVPIGFYVLSNGSHLKFMRRFYPSETPVLASLFIFGLGVVYMYFGDRTHLFGKVMKSFNADQFTWLMIATLLGGLVSLRSKKEGDQGFLNRAQTDEWKGWMQIIILVYHFLGASQTAGIYNVMRVLVAAYLFQTGYGHFFFFYKKSDFGLVRVLNVMVRLNLLTFVLMYVMDTNYLSYYFTPLVTFWFGVIWVTMYIGHGANKIVWFVLLKIAIMGVLTGVFIHLPGVLEGTFDVLEFLFNIHWDAVDWRFRLALDAWIVYGGMIFALATIKFSEHKLHEHRLWPIFKIVAVIISFLAMVWYFNFELSQPNKKAYTAYQPYISWIPILAFVTLRNATVRLRNTTSRFYEFIGKCSLETFIGQFHMWLAADTKGLLIVLTDPTWAQGLGWWFNLAVSSCLFLFVCYYLNQTTGDITKWIVTSSSSNKNESAPVRLPQQEHQQHPNDEQDVPLLPTSSASSNQEISNDDGKPEQTSLIGHHDDEEAWGAASGTGQQSRWRRWIGCVCGDLRLKTVVFLACMGIINRFC